MATVADDTGTHISVAVAAAIHPHVKADITDFPHTHVKADITDFPHTHVKADITDFAHTHAAADITSGVLATDRGALGRVLTPTYTNDFILVFKTATNTFVMEAKPAGGAGVAREDLVAHWTLLATKTNIGTAYVDIYTGTGQAGLVVKVDFTDKTQRAATIQWNKVGTGTQTVRAVDADNVANVLFETASLVTGENDVALAALPAWATGTKRIKLQGKSTVSTDDPVFQACSIRLK